MADEETKAAEEESLWWAFDAAPDSPVSDASFDEPLEWPDALPWEEFDSGEAPVESLSVGMDADGPDDTGVDLLFPPVSDPAPVEAHAPWPDPADGGSSADLPTELHLESLPESIWAPDAELADQENGHGANGFGPGTAALPAFYAETDRPGQGRGPRWLALPRGNAAVIALIGFVSLVLLGMFLSVRARNDVPTAATQTTVPREQISATRPLNTVPVTVITTTVPPPPIALSDLLPPGEPAATAPVDSPGPTAGGGTGAAPRAAAPVTTASPARSAAPAGGSSGGGGGTTGGGGGGDTTTAPQTTTTAAPEPPPTTAPPVTSPPSDDTSTTPTTARRPSTSISIPTDVTVPTWTSSTTVPPSSPFPTITFPTTVP